MTRRRRGPFAAVPPCGVPCLIALLAAATPLRGQQPEVFVGRSAELYVGGTVIDGRGGPPRPSTAILVSDGRIEAIGARDQMVLPPGTAVVDLEGAVVVPGYLDAYAPAHDSATLARALAVGITGAREPAMPLAEFRRTGRSIERAHPSPDVFIGGPVLEAGADATGVALADEGEAEAAVRRLVEDQGAPFVSVGASVPAAWIPAITRAARRLDTRVWANPRAEGWLLALRAGVDVSSGLVSGDPELLTEERRPGYATAIATGDGGTAAWLSALDPDGAEVERAITALLSRDAAVIPLLAEAAARAGATVGWPTAERLTRRLHTEGVRLLVGSGAGGADGFHAELERLVAAGIPPVEVLSMATRNAAAALGVLHERGTLEMGKRADFVVLEGDPLTDIRNARRVDFLVVDGDPWRPRPEGGFERLRFR